MPAQMTPTARSQGTKNAAICGLGLLLAWGIMTTIVSLVVDEPLSTSGYIAFAALCVVSLLGFFASWLYGSRIAGPVLLDCGLHPSWKSFLFNAGTFLIIGVTGAVAIDPIVGALFGNSFAVYWLVVAAGRLQVRENGLWQYSGLLRWSQIGSYAWAPDGTLMITHRTFAPSKGALPVSPEHRQAVDQLLSKYCRGNAAAVN
jgi:hypothetical protein